MTVVWFEAWRYQHEKAPIVALLQEIRAQLPWTSKALARSRKMGEVAIRGALLSLEDLTKRIGIQATKIQEAGERWEEENLATRLPAHMIRDHLEEALGKLLRVREGDEDNRLVVLVDDLDRCESETAYQLLEGIKIYLNLPSCVFVLGMNQDIIEGAVGRHLETNDSERTLRARQYLEKLCQNVWHIDPVRDPGTLLKGYVKGHAAPEAMADVVSEFQCLPPVPRKIKGYANLLLRFEGHLETCRKNGAGDGVAPDHWAKVAVVFTYLYHFHHRLYRLLWETPREFYDELLAWCEGRPTSASDHFKNLDRRLAPPARASRQADVAEQNPTPRPKTPELSRVFLDPAADNILHVEHLLRDLGSSVTDDEVEANLLQ